MVSFMLLNQILLNVYLMYYVNDTWLARLLWTKQWLVFEAAVVRSLTTGSDLWPVQMCRLLAEIVVVASYHSYSLC